MAKLIHLQTISSEKGNLTVFEKILPEGIKRIFYIYDAKNQVRGGQRHELAYNALTCVSGKCKVLVDDGNTSQIFCLDTPDTCLLLDPIDWHEMYDFSENAVLLVMSNRFYEQEDYIYEKYPAREKATVE
jgi:WxcM-like, C-terminal